MDLTVSSLPQPAARTDQNSDVARGTALRFVRLIGRRQSSSQDERSLVNISPKFIALFGDRVQTSDPRKKNTYVHNSQLYYKHGDS